MPKKVSVSTGFELCFPDTTWVLISTELLMPNHRHFGSSPVKKTNKQNKAKQTKKEKGFDVVRTHSFSAKWVSKPILESPIGEVVNQVNIQTLWKKVVMKYYGGPHDMVISYEGPTILTAYCKSSSGNKGRMVITFPLWKTSFQHQCSLFQALTP